MSSVPRPLLVYDGECGFCRFWVARWRHVTLDRVDYEPWQSAASRHPEIPRERFAESVQWIGADGSRAAGAEAIFRALACAPGRGAPLWLYRRAPAFAAASEAIYRAVAAHRPALSRITRWLWGGSAVPPPMTRTAWLFLRMMGVVYAIAFASLGSQVLGLVGSGGILPARELLAAGRAQAGSAAYLMAPTLLWLRATDGALLGLCGAGVGLAALLVAGLAPAPCLIGLWALYLSLATVCREFLWFQWDSLLLETGLLAILLAPWRWWSRPGSDPPPPRAALALLRWLLFRLLVSSAVVKLASGDPTWRNLSALTFYYETQPLPPWTAWYVHHLPAGFHHAAAAAMFVIEGLVPFLIVAPRRLRLGAAAAMIGFQLVIAVTGNYGFFNLLTIALCVLVLDDAVWPRGVGRPADTVAAKPHRLRAWLLAPPAVALALLSLVPFLATVGLPRGWLGPVNRAYEVTLPFRSIDNYGLFQVMTTTRPEIVFEGSDDGVTWKPYELRWKPGDPMRRPGFVAPHMPRLDWQLWFAALAMPQREPWCLAFAARLLEGSRPVLALLGTNPFPAAPPRYLRARLFDYRFTDAATRRATGAWWRRDPSGTYLPPLTIENGQLTLARGIPDAAAP